jgi:hypothetical protein
MPEYIYGETGPEMDIIRDLLRPKNWPVRVSVGLAEAASTDGEYAFVCVRHPGLGIMAEREYKAHLTEGRDGRQCISCGRDQIESDGLMAWTLPADGRGRFPVVVTRPDGTVEHGAFLGGSTLLWLPLAMRCLPCLEAGAQVHASLQAHDNLADNLEKRRQELRRQVHPE